MSAEAGEHLAHLLGVHQRLFGLAPHEFHDRDPVGPAHHQGVVGVPDHSGQLELDDPLEEVDHLRVVTNIHALSCQLGRPGVERPNPISEPGSVDSVRAAR